jgi:hypothetical protein
LEWNSTEQMWFYKEKITQLSTKSQPHPPCPGPIPR